MAIEDGAWIVRGLDWDVPSRIQSWEELIDWIDEVGFLPPVQKRGRRLLRGGGTPPTSIGGRGTRNRIPGSGGG